jgi:flagellar hook-associated protein 2
MDPIASFSGLASGIQWRDMIEEIVRVDRVRQVGPLTLQMTAQQSRLESWRQMKTHVAKLTTAAKALRDGSPFQAFRASVTPTDSGRVLLSATASSAATPGTYTVEVLGLARAEKLGSAAHTSATESLGLTGGVDGESNPLPLSFSINGRSVEFAQEASLNQIRDAINEANTGLAPSGVGATILTTAAGEHRLILTAEQTGTAGIQLIDGEDEVLAQLGIAPQSRSVQLQGALDGEPAPPLASILGIASPPAVRTIVIDGHEIQVDLATDTLSSLLDKVRAAAVAAGKDPEQAASIVEETNDQGQTVHRLVVQGGVVGKWDDADTTAILDALGFTRENSITAGRDAQFSIDGFVMTRPSNAISDALEGVTLSLQQAEVGSPVEMRIDRDVDRTVDGIKALVSAYNELASFVRIVTAPGQPLANNSSVKMALSSITGAFLTDLQGTDEEAFTFARATLVGVSMTRNGTMEIDDAKLRAALASHPADVRRLFEGFPGGSEGLAGKLTSIGEWITRSGDGLVDGQTDSIQRSLDSLSRRVDDAESRLGLRQESLIRQFTRMEEALSKLQAQSSWLASQIQALQPRDRR